MKYSVNKTTTSFTDTAHVYVPMKPPCFPDPHVVSGASIVIFFSGKRSTAQSDAQATRPVSSKPTTSSSPVTSTVTLVAHRQESIRPVRTNTQMFELVATTPKTPTTHQTV